MYIVLHDPNGFVRVSTALADYGAVFETMEEALGYVEDNAEQTGNDPTSYGIFVLHMVKLTLSI